MPSYGSPGNIVPPGEDWMNRRHEDLAREVKELAPSIIQTIRPLIEDLQAHQAELEAQNDALEAQQVAILELIDSQVSLVGAWGDTSGYAISTTSTTVLTAGPPIVIPAGYTEMSFQAIGTAQVGNTSGSTQWIFAQPGRLTNGSPAGIGTRQLVTLAPGEWATIICPYMFADPVTPGSVIEFYLDVYASTTALAASGSNAARLEVSVTLTR